MKGKVKSDGPNVLDGLGLGILATIPAVALAVASGGAGHGEYVAARLFFPYTMLLTVHTHYISLPLIIIALLQFPMYGLAIGGTVRRKQTCIYVSAALGCIHVICVVLCFSGLLSFWSR
jgi:hypothetical protein